MERMHGGELFDRIVDGPLSERQSAEIVAQLLQALVYLHDQHIVHRDVKLENVMLKRQGANAIKLIDFGFATAFDPRSKLTQWRGTVEYSAPEMLAGKPYDEKVDVWSAGVCAYTMLTGLMLVEDGKIHFDREFQKLPFDARDFVKMLLRMDPSKRATAREALNHPWLTKHAPAYMRKAPPKPAAKHSKKWQEAGNLLLRAMAFGAMAV